MLKLTLDLKINLSLFSKGSVVSAAAPPGGGLLVASGPVVRVFTPAGSEVGVVWLSNPNALQHLNKH